MTKDWTLKEIDTLEGKAKGTAFRAFKALRDGWQEGVDYAYFAANSPTIQALKDKGRLYASSRQALLFSENSYQQMKRQIQSMSNDPVQLKAEAVARRAKARSQSSD